MSHEPGCPSAGMISDEPCYCSIPIAKIVGESVYLNQSRIGDFLRCEELYHLNWEFKAPLTGDQPEEGAGLTSKSVRLPLVTGSAYHTGVSHYYHHNRDLDGAIQVAMEAHDVARADASLMNDEIPLWDKDKQIVAFLLASYHAKYKGEALQVLMPEASGIVRLGSSPHFLVFRTDAVFNEYKTLGLLEYKTKGRTPSGLEIATIHTNLQPTAYLYGVKKATGLGVSIVKYRWAIKKPEYELSRVQIGEDTHRTDADLKRFEEEAIDVAERILARRKDGKWLHNWNQCTVFGECDKRLVCIHHRASAVLTRYKSRTPDYVDEARASSNQGEALHEQP